MNTKLWTQILREGSRWVYPYLRRASSCWEGVLRSGSRPDLVSIASLLGWEGLGMTKNAGTPDVLGNEKKSRSPS